MLARQLGECRKLSGKTREEWIQYHDDRAARHGEEDLFYEKFCTEVFSAEHGIFQYVIQKDTMFTQEIIGDWKFWEEWALWICRTCGIEKVISFAKTKKPQRLERLYKTKAISCNENGVWAFERTVV